MRTWVRLSGPVTKPCGRCGHAIAVGAAHVVITIPGVARVIRRCATCAEEPVPPAVAPLPDATTAYADEHGDALVMGTLAMDVDTPTFTVLQPGTRRRAAPWAAFDTARERKSG